MDRDEERENTFAEGEETVREGSLIIEERMSRREGLVEYEGTVGEAGATGAGDVVQDATFTTGLTGSETVGGGGAETMGAGTADAASAEATSSGAVADIASATGAMSQVTEGMRVVDANGDDLGQVDYVKMGDPQAVTTMGEDVGDAGTFGAGGVAGGGATGGSGGAGSGLVGGGFVGGDGGEPNVDDPLRSQLVRTGFIKVGGSGWFGKDRYVSADAVAGVSGDTVQLNLTKDQLAEG